MAFNVLKKLHRTSILILICLKNYLDMKDELILFTTLEENFYKSNSDYLNLTHEDLTSEFKSKKTRFPQIGKLNYKFKRKSKNFFSWLVEVKNIHYSKTEGAVLK